MEACANSAEKRPWVPHIRFRAAWLREAGFDTGATFTVSNPEPGVLTLRANQLSVDNRSEGATAVTRN